MSSKYADKVDELIKCLMAYSLLYYIGYPVVGNHLLKIGVCNANGHHHVESTVIDQFQYIKIQLKRINMTSRLRGIKIRIDMSFFPRSLR